MPIALPYAVAVGYVTKGSAAGHQIGTPGPTQRVARGLPPEGPRRG